MNRMLVWTTLFVILAPVNVATAADQVGPTGKSKPRLVIVIAEGEYKTDQTLPPFAEKNLTDAFQVTVLFANKNNPNDIPGLEALETADVALLSIRRRPLPPKQLDLIRRYVKSGKPLVAVRTSSHAFCLRNKKPPSGLAEWPTFDKDILGCNYRGHHGNRIKTFVRVVAGTAKHPILSGVTHSEFRDFGSLYQSLPVAKTATVLMTGRAEDLKPHEPVAWINKMDSGGRIFYTSLGHPQNFAVPDFVRILRNAVHWTAGVPVPEKAAVVLQNPPIK